MATSTPHHQRRVSQGGSFPLRVLIGNTVGGVWDFCVLCVRVILSTTDYHRRQTLTVCHSVDDRFAVESCSYSKLFTASCGWCSIVASALPVESAGATKISEVVVRDVLYQNLALLCFRNGALKRIIDYVVVVMSLISPRFLQSLRPMSPLLHHGTSRALPLWMVCIGQNLPVNVWQKWFVDHLMVFRQFHRICMSKKWTN